MIKIILSALFFTNTALADAVIFSGNDVKTLKQNIDLFGVAKILSGSLNPSSGGGVAAPQGSIYMSTTVGLYEKTGAGNTAWTKYALLPVNLATQVTGTLPVTNGGTGTATAFTQGSAIFAGASGVYTQDNANYFWDNTNKRLGIGLSAPIAALDATSTSTITSGTISGSRLRVFANPASTSTGTFNGILATATSQGSSNISTMVASNNLLSHGGSGTITSGFGTFSQVVASGPMTTGIGTNGQFQNFSTATTANATGVLGSILNSSTGAITNAYGLRSTFANPGGGNVDSWYGLFIASISGTAPVTNRFPIFVQDTGNNYFAGSLGLGVTAPAARLHQDSGTGTASAHKFTAGTTTGQTASDGFDLGISTTGVAELRQRENLSMAFFTNNNQQMTLASSGYLGIGTASPQLPLHVLSTAPAANPVPYRGGMIIEAEGTNSAIISSTSYSDTTAAGFIGQRSRGTLASPTTIDTNDVITSYLGRVYRTTGAWNTVAGMIAQADQTHTSTALGSSLSFNTTSNNSTLIQERMRITNNGNVGIGLTVPAARLHQDSGTGANTLHKFTSGTTTGQLAADGFDVGYLAASGAYLWNNENSPMEFGTNNTFRMQISAAGLVAIGASAPTASAKLDIQGTDGALLLPRLTTAQKNALTPTAGMQVYDTTLGRFECYVAAWQQCGLNNPMTTQGDLIYGGASGTPTRLAAGTTGQILVTAGTGSAPVWQNLRDQIGSVTATTSGSETFRMEGFNSTTSDCTSSPCVALNKTDGISSVGRTTTGTYTVNFSPAFTGLPICTVSNSRGSSGHDCTMNNNSLTTSAAFVTCTTSNSGGTLVDSRFNIVCIGVR